MSNDVQHGWSILWLRHGLRLTDHPAWHAALEEQGPVFILDPLIESTYDAASKWRLGESLRSLAGSLERHDSRLLLQRGDALDVLQRLTQETGARRVVCSSLYDKGSIERDERVRAGPKCTRSSLSSG